MGTDWVSGSRGDVGRWYVQAGSVQRKPLQPLSQRPPPRTGRGRQCRAAAAAGGGGWAGEGGDGTGVEQCRDGALHVGPGAACSAAAAGAQAGSVGEGVRHGHAPRAADGAATMCKGRAAGPCWGPRLYCSSPKGAPAWGGVWLTRPVGRCGCICMDRHHTKGRVQARRPDAAAAAAALTRWRGGGGGASPAAVRGLPHSHDGAAAVHGGVVVAARPDRVERLAHAVALHCVQLVQHARERRPRGGVLGGGGSGAAGRGGGEQVSRRAWVWGAGSGPGRRCTRAADLGGAGRAPGTSRRR
jgi:hypothetical protein